MLEADQKKRLTLGTFIDKKESKHKTAAIESLFDEEFKKIRDLDNITNYDLVQSLDIERNREMVFKSGESAG